MNLAKKLLMTTGTSSGTVPTPSGVYVDDVFSTYLYTGNGSTQTINNGIDLAGEGGLVWTKSRTGPATAHGLFDTQRGASKRLESNATSAQFNHTPHGVASFGSNGFTVVDDGAGNYITNVNAVNYTSWTFRKAPKFFDVVTYTGNGVAGRQIAHSLGVQAGFVTVKATSTTGDWNSYHRSATGDLKLNTTEAQTASRTIITAADASTFTVSGAANTNGTQYVAYLFAHDPSEEGIIQCGSFTTDSSGNATVNLGWEPQYVMLKTTDATGNWTILDSMRGMTVNAGSTSNLGLYAENSAAEIAGITRSPLPNTLGFSVSNVVASRTFIYMTIRRPNKPLTSGTQVYNAIARTGTGAAATVTGVGFAPDLVNIKSRSTASSGKFFDRLRGASYQILTSTTDAEQTFTNTVTSIDVNGISLGSDGGTSYVNTSGDPVINHFFRRAPGFFDVVVTRGITPPSLNHSLGVTPEIIIQKILSAAGKWYVWLPNIATKSLGALNTTNGFTDNMAAATTTTFASFGYSGAASTAAYLFASLPGISKVGSYSGNGSTQTIPCGFTTGSRFVLIKRIDNTGDWFVWDTARGIAPTTDPHLSLNTTAAEVTTDDSIDQDTSGFIVNQNAATNINALGGNYLFLAIA